MKTRGRWAVMAMMVLGWFTSYGQAVEPEVPGDHFSLEGALELFKKSESPQDFEKMLNSPDSKVNNLDLNGDGYIDYIRVLDRYEGDVHAFILQAVISESERQDIAVIELEKLSNGKAVLQIVGNEDIYGITTIIEPTREVRTYAGTRSSTTVVNVWAWPSVRYVYGPAYTVWVSPWGWHRHPVWYHRWTPVSYVHYYRIWRPYDPYYSICHTRRVVYARELYRPYRTTSVVVRKRYNDRIVRYRSEHRDDYRNGRGRDSDRRAYVDNDRSSRNTQRGREVVDANRRSTRQAETVGSGNRSAIRERSAATDSRRSSREMRTLDSGDDAVKTRRETQPRATRPAVNRNRSSESNIRQRPAVRERSAPANIQRNRPEVKRQASPTRRSGTVDTRPQRRPQVTRPSTVERSSPAARPNVQRHSAPRGRSIAAPNNRSTRQPASRSSSVNRSRSSGSPAVQQQRTPGRSAGATRSSDDQRRGRR